MPPVTMSASFPAVPPLKVMPPAGIGLPPEKFTVAVSLPPRVSRVIEPVTEEASISTVFALTCVSPGPARMALVGSVMRIFAPDREMMRPSLVAPPLVSVNTRLPPLSDTVPSVWESTTSFPVPPV